MNAFSPDWSIWMRKVQILCGAPSLLLGTYYGFACDNDFKDTPALVMAVGEFNSRLNL